MNKILLLDIVHETFPEMLRNEGYIVDILKINNENELKKIIANYNGIVLRNNPKITSDIIDCSKKLKFIARVGSGVENIDSVYANKKGIKTLSSPEGNCNAVGEHALGLTICLLKNISSSFEEIKNNKWDREGNRGTELENKTVGIIGYGNSGSAFAKKLSCMGVNILAYDKYKSNFGTNSVKESNLQEIFQNADIVSFHVPLNDETINYGNDAFFNSFLKSIYLLNTSRGKVVNSCSLVNAIKNKKVLGAGLDVVDWETYNFELENTENDIKKYLLNSPNVIITPHIAGITNESKKKHATVLFEKIILVNHKVKK